MAARRIGVKEALLYSKYLSNRGGRNKRSSVVVESRNERRGRFLAIGRGCNKRRCRLRFLLEDPRWLYLHVLSFLFTNSSVVSACKYLPVWPYMKTSPVGDKLLEKKHRQACATQRWTHSKTLLCDKAFGKLLCLVPSGL